MRNIKPNHSLPDPFPIKLLATLDFGSTDGHRDNVAEQAFVITSSVKQFFLNKHSIIIGAIGTGKSTLFRLLKNHSKDYESYKNDLIVPIEEALSFKELNSFVKEHFQGKEKKTLYQLIWKFNVLSKVAISISGLDNFPASKEEKAVNAFLMNSSSSDAYSNIVNKIKNLISNANIKFEARIADNPITFEAGFSDKKNKQQKKINLEEVQRSISLVIKERGFNNATVIIDKIDRFVAGAEYITQKDFITALLEVDDDFSADKYINLKIFLRSDLFERLDFSNLGYDKVHDNVVFLQWSGDETLRFLAKRILIALRNARISEPEQLFQATNIREYELTMRERILLHPGIPKFIKNLFYNKEMERGTSLYGKFDRAIITKLFPRNLIHYSHLRQTYEEISTFDFINNHFLDGNDVCTPRYILIFLKEVVKKVASYYDDNPDQIPELALVAGSLEWNLFKKNCVYEAYLSSKNIYVKNIGTVETKWTNNFNVFLNKRGNKTNFDYKWIKANIPDITADEAVDFLSFLQVIGFLKKIDANPDIKKRKYELPILYKISPR